MKTENIYINKRVLTDEGFGIIVQFHDVLTDTYDVELDTKIKCIKGPKKIFVGTNKEGKRIYFDRPTFDCAWYWGFGYLGNNNCHYHIKDYEDKQIFLTDDKGKFVSFTEKRNINMYDALLQDYELNPRIKENLWLFCELVLSIYKLKETAELVHNGSAGMTSNPGNLKNITLYNELTFKLIPEQCQLLWNLIK